MKYGFQWSRQKDKEHSRADTVLEIFTSTETERYAVDNNKAVADKREARRSVYTGRTDAQT